MSALIDEVFEKAGGRQTLQDKLGLSKQTMSDWKRSGFVPARHAAQVEAITGISRERLCPKFPWGHQEAA
jgi:DNA-binding transcriptional regulator YdaS (Cro superfamily)